jgi:hypothetical protein
MVDVNAIAEQLGLPIPEDGAALIQYGDDAPLEARLAVDEDLHGEILNELKARRDFSREYVKDRHEDWDRVREHNKMYLNLDRPARAGNRREMPNELEMPFQRSVVIPLSKATLDVLLTQIMSIYSARRPMMQVGPSNGSSFFKAKLLESMIAHDMMQTRGFSTLYGMFTDAFSFGNGYIYDSWEIDEGVTYSFEPLSADGVPPDIQQAVLGPLAYLPVRKIGVQREFARWQPISAYHVRPDPRVSQWDLQEGEFFGHYWKTSYSALLKKSGERGPYFNLDRLPTRALGGDSYDDRGNMTDPYNPSEPTAMNNFVRNQDRSWLNMETMVWELIPRKFKLGESEFPEKWLFSWAEDRTIVRAHPLVNKHQRYPYSCAQPDPEFYSVFAPGKIELIEPLQRFINWLYNSHIENITRMLNNQWVYSPRFIEELDLEFGGPGDNVRMTNEAADMLLNGEIQDIRQFLFQLPVQDVTGASYMNAIQYTYQMAQTLSGVNDPLTGIQLPTQRSATEVSTITSQASSRLAISAKLMDENAIQPLMWRTIHNRQQFTSIGRYYEIIGSMAEDLQRGNIYADLMDIQGEFKYVPITGIVPEDPSRSAATWSNMMAAAGQLPQLQQPGPDGRQLDFRKIFNTIAEQMGITNVEDYYMNVQVMPDEAVAAGAEAGSLVPMGGGGPPAMPPG